MPYMNQKISYSLNTKLNDTVKICHLAINNLDTFTIYESLL